MNTHELRHNLDSSQMRIRHCPRTPYERVFSAMVYCLRNQDEEAALILRGLLRLL